MPWPKLRLQACGQRSFLHALVDLKQMRMTGGDANPKDFRRTFGRKSPCADQGQKKRMKLNCRELLTQSLFVRLRNVSKKGESEMKLIGRSPAYARQFGIEIAE